MNNPENTRTKALDWVLSALTVPATQYLRTYRWAIRAPVRYDGLQRPDFAVSWIQFLSIASTALVIAMMSWNVFAAQINVVALLTSGSMRSLEDQVRVVSESAARINADVQAFRLSSHSLVPIVAISAWMAIVVSLSLITNVQWKGRRIVLKGFERTCYVLTAHTLRSSIGWGAAAFGAFALQAMGVPLVELMSSSMGASVYTLSNIMIAVAVVVWTQWRLKKERGIWTPPASNIAILMSCATLFPVILINIGGCLSQFLPPKLHFSVSAQCEEDQCFAYIQSKNARRVVLDGFVSVVVQARFQNAQTNQPEEGYFNARIYLAKPQPGAGPPYIEPGVVELVRVRKIAVSCPSNIVKDGLYTPISIRGGQALVYILDSSSPNERARIEFDPFTGFIDGLLLGAEGECKVGLVPEGTGR